MGSIVGNNETHFLVRRGHVLEDPQNYTLHLPKTYRVMNAVSDYDYKHINP